MKGLASKGEIRIRKILALVLAASVVICSTAIFAAVGPAVNLLATIEKQYEQNVHDTDSLKQPESRQIGWTGKGSGN